jgi:hypothetical protein
MVLELLFSAKIDPDPGRLSWYFTPPISDTWPLPSNNSPLSAAYSGYWIPTRTSAPAKPTSEYRRVLRCTFCHSATISAGTARIMVSLESTESAAARPEATWCQRCLRGEYASTKAASIHGTAKLSRKICRCTWTGWWQAPGRSVRA